MTDTSSRPASPAPDPAAGEEDPLAADRRTLAIGAAAVVGFVLVGVVSAQLFVTGGCLPVGEPRGASATGVDPAELLDDDQLAQLRATFPTDATQALVVPGDVRQLADAPGGSTVLAGTLTALDDDGEPTAELDVPGTVVGDGETIFDLALTNELTGQVDGFTPIDATTLTAGECTDTTLVNEQFAFLLDAGDGHLLQLRLDEDGDAPSAQLHDADGPVAEVALELPAGPAGTLGERTTGAIADDHLLVARRVTPDDPGAALVVADRASGERVLEHDLATLRDAADGRDEPIDPEDAVRVGVHGVVDGQAVVSLRPDPAHRELARDDVASVLLVDLDDGGLRWVADGPGRVADAADGPDGQLAVAFERPSSPGDGGVGEVSVLVVAGDDSALHGPVSGQLRSLTWDAQQPVVVADGGHAALPPDGTGGGEVDDTAVTVRTVHEREGRTTVVVRAGGRSVLLSD